ncbi:MAG TPA: hypothetical protein DEP35_24865 [Deltaproteobacteria bacterium]|jgi:hypothetical protein|nr:hypothetical protein [Deltaproteobacteria bacterium]
MHSNITLTNALLSLIAISLILIVLRLYGIALPANTANAAEVVGIQSVQVSNVPLPVRLVGDPVKVQLYWQDRKHGWLPVAVDGGALVIRQ